MYVITLSLVIDLFFILKSNMADLIALQMEYVLEIGY